MSKDSYQTIIWVLMCIIGVSQIILNKQWVSLSCQWAKLFNSNKGIAGNTFAYRVFYYGFGAFFTILSAILIFV